MAEEVRTSFYNTQKTVNTSEITECNGSDIQTDSRGLVTELFQKCSEKSKPLPPLLCNKEDDGHSWQA